MCRILLESCLRLKITKKTPDIYLRRKCKLYVLFTIAFLPSKYRDKCVWNYVAIMFWYIIRSYKITTYLRKHLSSNYVTCLMLIFQKDYNAYTNLMIVEKMSLCHFCNPFLKCFIWVVSFVVTAPMMDDFWVYKIYQFGSDIKILCNFFNLVCLITSWDNHKSLWPVTFSIA